MSQDHQHPDITASAKLVVIIWMAGAAVVFVLVSMSAEGPVAAAVPQFLLQAREVLLPFFQAPALY